MKYTLQVQFHDWKSLGFKQWQTSLNTWGEDLDSILNARRALKRERELQGCRKYRLKNCDTGRVLKY